MISCLKEVKWRALKFPGISPSEEGKYLLFGKISKTNFIEFSMSYNIIPVFLGGFVAKTHWIEANEISPPPKESNASQEYIKHLEELKPKIYEKFNGFSEDGIYEHILLYDERPTYYSFHINFGRESTSFICQYELKLIEKHCSFCGKVIKDVKSLTESLDFLGKFTGTIDNSWRKKDDEKHINICKKCINKANNITKRMGEFYGFT